MGRPLDRLADDLGSACPICEEEFTEAHARGREIVLVPCGHTIDASAVLGMSIPDDPDAPSGDAANDAG